MFAAILCITYLHTNKHIKYYSKKQKITKCLTGNVKNCNREMSLFFIGHATQHAVLRAECGYVDSQKVKIALLSVIFSINK